MMREEDKPLAASQVAGVEKPLAKPQAASPSRRKFVAGAALVVVLVLLGGALAYFALRGPRDDLGRFQGEWKLTTADRESQFPTTVRVTGDKWVYRVADKDQKRYAITLRPDADPKEIDLTQFAADGTPVLEKRDGTFVPVVHRGIYTIEDGKAKMLTAPNPHPRPTSFDATDGAPVWLLERQ